MKLNYDCGSSKPIHKGGVVEPCKCAYLNRKYLKNLKIWNQTLVKK